MNQNAQIFIKTILKALLATGAGFLIVYLCLPENAFEINKMCHINGFARRWDGSCSGWTNLLALAWIKGSALHWWAYCTMSIVIYDLHPVIVGNIQSRITVILTSAFVFGCGITHLLDIYSVLAPIYYKQAAFLNINGYVSCTAMFFVTYGLLRGRMSYIDRVSKMDKQSKELERLKNKYGQS